MNPGIIALLVVSCIAIVVVGITIAVRIVNMRDYCRHVWKIVWQWPPEYRLVEKFIGGKRKAMIVMVCERCGLTEEHKAA